MIVKGRHKWLANKTIESEFTPKYEQIFTDKWILTFTEDSLINVWEVYLLTFLSGQCVILKNISLFFLFCFFLNCSCLPLLGSLPHFSPVWLFQFLTFSVCCGLLGSPATKQVQGYLPCMRLSPFSRVLRALSTRRASLLPVGLNQGSICSEVESSHSLF